MSDFNDMKYEREFALVSDSSSKYYFMLEKRWHDQWLAYVDGNSDVKTQDITPERFENTLRFFRPSYVTNFDLVEMDDEYMQDYQRCLEESTFAMAYERFSDWTQMRLKPNLIKNQDYVLVGHRVWKKFVALYGGGPEIVVFPPEHDHSEMAHPLTILTGRFDESHEFAELRGFLASPNMTLRAYSLYICHMLLIPPHKAAIAIMTLKNEPLASYGDQDTGMICFRKINREHDDVVMNEIFTEGCSLKLIVRQIDYDEDKYEMKRGEICRDVAPNTHEVRRRKRVDFSPQKTEAKGEYFYDAMAHNSNLSEEEAIQRAINASLGIEDQGPVGGGGGQVYGPHREEDYFEAGDNHRGTDESMAWTSTTQDHHMNGKQDHEGCSGDPDAADSQDVRKEIDPEKVHELREKAAAAMQDPGKFSMAIKKPKEIRNSLNQISKELAEYSSSLVTSRVEEDVRKCNSS